MKKLLLAAVLTSSLVLSACGSETESAEEATTEAVEETTTAAESTEESSEESTDSEAGAGATIKTSYGAPHGDKSFSVIYVTMDGDTITDVVIDEFQYLDAAEATGVPNSDAAFGNGDGEDVVLASKLENNELYSGNMAAAGSTVAIADNFAAIEDFAIGKTVADLEAAIEELNGLGEEGSVADVVSGATLVDTPGYLQAIIDTANDGTEFVGVEDADLSNATLKYGLGAPHGDQSFAVVSVLTDGKAVLAAAVDEFQYLDAAEFEGVPNSDGGFGENYAEDVVLGSKIVNNEGYSAMMTDYADSTTSYVDNMNAVIDFAEGKTAEEIEAGIEELNGLGEEDSVADVVSGATFADTAGYLQAILDVLNQ